MIILRLFIIITVLTTLIYGYQNTINIKVNKNSLPYLNRKRLHTIRYLNEVDIPSFDANIDLTNYTPPEVSNEIYIGSFIAILPIIWATIEFNSRIQTQRSCLACSGSGLVYYTKQGNKLSRPRKCWSCGGFIPWLGWKMFFFSSFTDIGNGGPLQRPSKDYYKNNMNILSGELEFKDNKPEDKETVEIEDESKD